MYLMVSNLELFELTLQLKIVDPSGRLFESFFQINNAFSFFLINIATKIYSGITNERFFFDIRRSKNRRLVVLRISMKERRRLYE